MTSNLIEEGGTTAGANAEVADVYAFEGSLEEDRAVVLLNGSLSPIPNRVEARGANLELGPPPDAMKAADP